MARYMGDDYKASVYAYFRVLMARRRTEEEIDEESFNATCRLYQNDSDIEVVDNKMISFKHINVQGVEFTAADVRLDLRINVRGVDYDEACSQADGMVSSITDELPAGVAYVDCDIYDAECCGPAVDWDWAV